MAIQLDRVSFGIGSSDWAKDVAALTELIGSPSVVQEGEWAQFDLGGARVAVGTADDLPAVALMCKVGDVNQAAGELRDAGWQVDEAMRGAHELRARAQAGTGLHVILYQPLA